MKYMVTYRSEKNTRIVRQSVSRIKRFVKIEKVIGILERKMIQQESAMKNDSDIQEIVRWNEERVIATDRVKFVEVELVVAHLILIIQV